MHKIPLLLLAWILILYPASSSADGEHQRRFTVELALVAGDSRLLAEQNDASSNKISKQKQQWIQSRLISSVNQLPLLARYFQQEKGTSTPSLLKQLQALKQQLNNPTALRQQSLSLSKQYPVIFSLSLPQPLTAKTRKTVISRYNRLCLGCHFGPAGEKSVVIGDLASFARSMDNSEWLARLIGGLHGDAYTGLENPFSDQDIAQLFGYIRSNKIKMK